MRIAICDDHKETIDTFLNKAKAICKSKNIEAHFTSYLDGDKLLFAVDDYASRPDVLLLDINMPGIDGLTVAEELRRRNLPIEIVFITASDQIEHLQKAFDVKASNYFIKNRDTDERFSAVLCCAIENAEERKAEILTVNCAGQTRNINVRKIYFFECRHNILTVHYAVGQQKKHFDFYSTIAKMENTLWERGFLKCHRSFLVNMEYILEIGIDEIVLTDGSTVPIGKTKKAVVEKALRAVTNNRNQT
jgi:Response regulator of the LytR/AlgR family